MGLSSQLAPSAIAKPGVCTSTTRPASPYEGQVIYTTDTDLLQIWNGTAWRTLAFGTPTNGTVLQVVNATYSTSVTNNTNVYADTGLTATITPTSTTSKVLVLVSQNGCAKNSGNLGSAMVLRLVRGSTELLMIDQGAGYTGVSAENWIGGLSICQLDSPATTSATTYKTQFRNNVNAAGVQVQVGVSSGNNPTTSGITLMEIAA